VTQVLKASVNQELVKRDGDLTRVWRDLTRRAGKDPDTLIVIVPGEQEVEIYLYHDFDERYPMTRVFGGVVRRLMGLV
jgi:hypothetical protein